MLPSGRQHRAEDARKSGSKERDEGGWADADGEAQKRFGWACGLGRRRGTPGLLSLKAVSPRGQVGCHAILVPTVTVFAANAAPRGERTTAITFTRAAA